MFDNILLVLWDIFSYFSSILPIFGYSGYLFFLDTRCDHSDPGCCELRSPLFCLLTDQEQHYINSSKITIHYDSGETIRKQGTFMSHVATITSGLAKMYLEGPNRQRSMLRIVKAGGFIGGPGLYLDRINHFSVTALTETTVCLIEADLFKELIDQNRQFAHGLMREFSQNILSVYRRLVNLTQKQMPGRMADTLIYLVEEVFESMAFPAYLTKQDMAALSGMAKESAIKVLRDFQHSQIIRLTAREWEVLDMERLSRISQTG